MSCKAEKHIKLKVVIVVKIQMHLELFMIYDMMNIYKKLELHCETNGANVNCL